MRHCHWIRYAAVALIALAVSGCGDDEPASSPSPPAATPTPEPSPTPSPSPTPTGAVVVDARLTQIPSFTFGTVIQTDPDLLRRFSELVGWSECVTYSADQPTSQIAECQVKSLQLSARNRVTGKTTVLAVDEFAEDIGMPLRFDDEVQRGLRAWRYRGNGDRDWYGGPEVALSNSLVVAGPILILDIAKTPADVAHFWTFARPPTANTRAPAPDPRDYEYLIEVQFKTVGRAALRVGLDGWAIGGATPYCPTSNDSRANCEVAHGPWYSTDTDAFATVVLRINPPF